MINNSEDSNIKVTDDQEKQLDIFNRRLAGLKTEIDIHAPIVSSLRIENANLEQNHSYLQGHVKSLEEMKKILEKTNDDTNNQVSGMQNQLRMAQEEHAKVKSDISIALEDLEAQRNDLKNKAVEIENNKIELNKELIKFAQDKDLLAKKHQILSEALKACGNI